MNLGLKTRNLSRITSIWYSKLLYYRTGILYKTLFRLSNLQTYISNKSLVYSFWILSNLLRVIEVALWARGSKGTVNYVGLSLSLTVSSAATDLWFYSGNALTALNHCLVTRYCLKWSKGENSCVIHCLNNCHIC